MSESKQLLLARERLARAESKFESSAAMADLEEGLALLGELIEDDDQERGIAQNLARTYAGKIFARVRTAVTTDRATPQPQLEHYFKLMLAFDAGDFALPEAARATKIAVVRRLIDLLYEGHSPEHKQAALSTLAEITKL